MVEVNLLPAGQRRQSSGAGQGWLIAAGAAALLSLLTVAGLELYYLSQVNGLKAELEQLNGEITALEPAKREYDELQTEKTELQQVTDVARALRDRKTYWSNDLAAFTAQMPANRNIALTSLEMRPVTQQTADMQQSGVGTGTVSREFAITGTATSQQSVIDLLNAFESNPDFGIVFQGMQREEAENPTSPYTFTANVGVAGEEVAAQTAADGTVAPGAAAAAAPAPAPATTTPAGGTP